MFMSGYLLEMASKTVREIEEKSAKDIEYQTSSALLLQCCCLLFRLPVYVDNPGMNSLSRNVPICIDCNLDDAHVIISFLKFTERVPKVMYEN